MLLTTKLFAPRRQPQLISRHRLHALLDAGLQGKVILVSAPAGFGKTTLVVDWLDGLRASAVGEGTDHQMRKLSSTWLSLDEQDNDPVRFLTYLVAALQTISPLLGRGLQNLLGGPQPPALNNALTMLLNDLAGFEQPFVLVLDDYHVIHQAPIHQALTFLVEHLPPVLHLVITSRTDPTLPLARWRMRRELTEVRERDLRFNHEETASFLRQTLQIEITRADLQALEQRTEGWITGLQLVALSMDGRPDLPQFVAAFTGSHAYIVDYLSEEVLQRQSPPVQEFLLRTAILNRLSAPLCDWVTDEAVDGGRAQTMLEQLERNRLFVLPLDSERKWYRYHHLFADLLRGRLRQREPELVAQLHRRASRWFANQGLNAEAIDHAIQARDFAQAAEIIEGQAEALTKRGEHHTLATWIEQLPPASTIQRPRLGIVYALYKVLQHDLAGAEVALQTVAPAVHTTHRALLGEYQTVQATIASKGNQFEKAETLAREAWELLPTSNAFLRGRLMVIIGVGAYYRDDHERALVSFAEAGRLALSAGDLNTALNALANEALVFCLRGELRRAAVAFRHILKLATDHGAAQLSNIAMVHGHLADLRFELNDLAGMRHHLELTRASLVYGQMPALELEYQIYLAKLHQAEGNRGAAILAIQQAFAIAEGHQMPASNRGEVIACQVRLWLAYGNLDDATTWADSSGLSADDELTALREPEYVALARVLIARGEASQALLLLARLHKAADLVGRRWVQIELLALQAVAHAARGNRRSAHETVRQALQLGLSEGYIRSFVLAGETFQALLLEAQPQIDEPHLRQYAKTVLAAFPPANAALPDEQASMQGNQSAVALLAPLTEREIEVLRLVAAGFSDREIADQLVVVVGTAKRHLNNIYGKLLVHSRTQALVRARALGLLE